MNTWEQSTLLLNQMNRSTDRTQRVKALVDLAARMDIGAVIETDTTGDTLILIPRK
jgi:hypothetical protein